jgi:NAD(P)-dependent dehydrogenase (short-subunit alcohol dehydrogenase family)
MSGLRAAVWGASGGIGGALVDRLAASGEYATVYAGSRMPIAARAGVEPFAFDLGDEGSIAAAAGAIAAAGPVDLTLLATGLLHDAAGRRPEKSIAAVTADALTALFQVNAVGPILIAKHMIRALPKDRRSVIAALSARVGSIGDNRLGGWHSYRASKAALNMLLANLAIELRRTHPRTIVLGLHPGTVATRLSAPFQQRVPSGRLFTADISAGHLLAVIDAATEPDSGSVLAWDGQRIPA